MFCNIFRLSGRAGLAALVLTLASMPGLAQTPPDAGLILQETRPPLEQAPATVLPPIQAPAAPRAKPPVEVGDARVMVTQFDFVGNGALSSEALRVAVAAWVGRALNFGELIQAVEAVEARYKQAGFFLAQANLAPQKIKDGVIEISISEGRLGEARLEGESLVAPDVVYRYLDRLPVGEALTLPRLERQILLINELAGGQASLDLQAGGLPGSTDVVLVQKTEPAFNARLEANNHGLPSTGVNRLGLTLNANGPFNRGERISLNVLSSVNKGLVTYALRGELPVGGDGWRLSAAVSRALYSLGGDFVNLDANGTADSLRLGVSYPLIRSRARNLRFQLEADQSKLVDEFRAANVQFDKQSKGLSLSANADWLDELLGGGSTRLDLVLRTGQLDLGSAAAAADAPPTGPDTAGSFSKWTLTAIRQQIISPDVSLLFQYTMQAASKNLDSSEKFSLGGPALIPGYASGEASADSGQHLKLGARWQAQPMLALSVFADYAKLELSRNPLPTATTPNQRTLSDFGVSADWQFNKTATLSAILAKPGHDALNPADNGKTRLWLSLGYAW